MLLFLLFLFSGLAGLSTSWFFSALASRLLILFSFNFLSGRDVGTVASTGRSISSSLASQLGFAGGRGGERLPRLFSFNSR